MKISPGIILKADASLTDANFADAIILIAEHDESGSLGFMLNKLFYRTLKDLEEFAGGKAFPLFVGGPVKKDQLYFIHRRPDLIENGKRITGELFLGGDFDHVVAHINAGSLTEKDIRLFLGYCGWDGEELEEEINEGSWRPIKMPFTF